MWDFREKPCKRERFTFHQSPNRSRVRICIYIIIVCIIVNNEVKKLDEISLTESTVTRERYLGKFYRSWTRIYFQPPYISPSFSTVLSSSRFDALHIRSIAPRRLVSLFFLLWRLRRRVTHFRDSSPPPSRWRTISKEKEACLLVRSLTHSLSDESRMTTK